MEEYIQYRIVENGNIAPCPYKDHCLNCPAGCKGFSWWCGRKGTLTTDTVSDKIKAPQKGERL